ncbi:MAG: hypothetical protein HY706_18095 [Candidatus Hydrogenedentes bacterium]|nr:hypothetical protein [Candidatus Hydrogenedentota bacterium]
MKIKNAGKTTVSFTSQELLDICRTSKPMDGRDGLALPYPWTNLFPGHDDRCAVFSVADLEVPDPGMCGYLTVTLENPDDVPAELNEVYWALRLERFLDAI